ncbi:monocarboxylate transporter 13-like [Leguminivora glycinivorella]|uniref:monocarboxylate transporter 13-like n=1 Tax=Leguminivora glycinivorella TaxID=1035111 RepID=UPI00200CF838|nr:monocarboxylate transporter 13-like [Leguminivora glycinivorella]
MAVEARMKRYKKVPPDGGYGYCILVACTVNMISSTMFYVCFGMIYQDFFNKLGIGTTGISLLTGIRAVSFALAGFVSGLLMKVLSRRQMALVGATFYNSGMFGTVFVETEALFIFCQGFLQMVGIGFIYAVTCTCINDYFVDKRLLSTGIVQTMAATSAMAAPMIVSWTMSDYGYHCTLIVISSVGMQSFVAAMLLQPVEWHMKKVEITESEHITLMEKEKETPDQPDLTVTSKGSTSSMFVKIKTVLDWEMLKKYGRTSCCLHSPTALFADILFMFNFAQALYAIGWNEDQVKWCFSVIAFGDLAFRVILMVFSRWLRRLSNRSIYLLGLFLATATRIGLLLISDYIGTLVCLAVLGVSRCILVIMYPLVVSDQVTPDQFPLAFGLSIAIYGVVSICCGPIVGAIRDATNNYTILFSIVIAFLSVTTAAWAAEMFRDCTRQRREKRPHKNQ